MLSLKIFFTLNDKLTQTICDNFVSVLTFDDANKIVQNEFDK